MPQHQQPWSFSTQRVRNDEWICSRAQEQRAHSNLAVAARGGRTRKDGEYSWGRKLLILRRQLGLNIQRRNSARGLTRIYAPSHPVILEAVHPTREAQEVLVESLSPADEASEASGIGEEKHSCRAPSYMPTSASGLHSCSGRLLVISCIWWSRRHHATIV